ncbi:GEgh 16 [Mycena venus]|uniref:GEgh 16 n=1 Tax=Mycena venus TaxID=2733690 RepID=A0A8H6Y4D7_9AGAR|nr:GEgh 16 [Mycena venus]
MFFNTFIVFAAVSSSALLNVQAHGTITGVTGANGVQAAGFGIIASTPRDGTTRKPFQQDTSIIRDKEIASGKAGVCGRTNAGGNNDVAAQLAAASQAGLPTAAADGSVTMTLHQINGDGAGPYTCDVSGDGGNTFQAATVTQQVPGKNGRSQAKATDFPLTAQIPVGMACTAGPNGDACILRCRNPARAGPFGSCVAVAMDGAAAGNATTTADTVAGNATAGTAATDATAGAAATGATAGTAATSATQASGASTGATAGTSDTEATSATTGTATTGVKGGLAGLLSSLGGAGKAARDLSAKRYINSRVAGKRSGYWLDNQ